MYFLELKNTTHPVHGYLDWDQLGWDHLDWEKGGFSGVVQACLLFVRSFRNRHTLFSSL